MNRTRLCCRSVDRFPLQTLAAVLFSVTSIGWTLTTPVVAQEAVTDETAEPSATEESVVKQTNTVRFSFNGVSWREVISWIAQEADLALHIDSVPAGSFTYSDPSEFTYEAAIDRINLFLLPQGYSLVRNGNLLSVINLGDPRSLQQLDALAELVTLDELAKRESHEVVKCLFPLGQLTAEEAVEELSAIKLMMTPAVFGKTNQLMITETAGKLRSIQAILNSFEPSKMDNGTIVKSFMLEHVEAEDILVVARPHLGLATGEMIGIDVSLSADLQGKMIFATGLEDRVKLIERLVESIDVPTKSITDANSEAKLQTHRIPGGNVDLAYDVLQTLLAGRDARLSKDETAGTIVALATPEMQSEIEMTVAKLAAEEAQFEVIPLRNVDPYVAIGLIQQMLNIPSEFAVLDDDEEEAAAMAPKIDADPENKRLFVRGKQTQIEEIKRIVAGLEEKPVREGSASRIRLLSLRGNHARQALALAARFWREANPIILFDPQQSANDSSRERVIADLNERTGNDIVDGSLPEILEQRVGSQFVSVGDRGRLLPTSNADVALKPIECQVTERGILLQCDDLSVLDQFESHLEMLAGPGDSVPSEPVVYYLKYTRPADALRMLAELMDGGDAVAGDAGSLVNSSVSQSMNSLIGSLVTNRDGTMTLIAGTATVVADPRLNRLIAQGTTDDIQLIESYLKIIEKDSTLTTVETYGKARIIELENTRAVNVEAAIRQAFAGRIVAALTAPKPGAAGGDASRADARDSGDGRGDDRSNSKKGNSNKASGNSGSGKGGQEAQEPQMTLAVHEASNSLIVTAPEHLFKEVELLAKTIDGRGEQTIQVITPSNSDVLQAVLQQVLEGRTGSTSSRSSSSANRSDPRASSRSRQR